MSESHRLGAALLAAGSSRRFGSEDKLVVELNGFMLGQNAAFVFPFDRLHAAWVIMAERGHPCEPGWHAMGFDPVANPDAHEGMGTSVALAARMAQQEKLDALAIVLADMPMVPATHYDALIDEVTGPDDIAVSAIGDTRMPPAVFGSAHFPALAELTGDIGARDLLMQGHIVECPPEWLIDIDRPEDLQRYGQAGEVAPKHGAKGE